MQFEMFTVVFVFETINLKPVYLSQPQNSVCSQDASATCPAVWLDDGDCWKMQFWFFFFYFKLDEIVDFILTSSPLAVVLPPSFLPSPPLCSLSCLPPLPSSQHIFFLFSFFEPLQAPVLTRSHSCRGLNPGAGPLFLILAPSLVVAFPLMLVRRAEPETWKISAGLWFSAA